VITVDGYLARCYGAGRALVGVAKGSRRVA
jgi:hypothetical protein